MAFQKSDQDKLVKLLIIGDSGVGKTCLLMRFCENMFTNNHLTTIGIDFKLKSLEIGGKKVKLQIWDTAGQERFRTITQTYYKGAHGIILTYGVDDKVSFQRFIDYGNNSIENWVRQIKMHAQENVCKILVGNKSDSSDRVVQTEEGQKLADEYGIPFFETSAKAGVNVKQIFESVGQMCYDKLSEQSNNDQEPKIVLNYQSSQPLIEKKKKTSCC